MGEHAGVRRAPAVQLGCGERRRVGRARRGRPKKQWRRRRRRPREAHAAAHLRIVPVDVPSKVDQPPELRLVAVPCGLPHGLAHRVAHRVRRALCPLPLGHLRIRGHARLRGEAREAAARTPSRCACAARPHAPRSSGGRGSRGARARRGRSKRPRRAAATPGSRRPEQRGMGVRSSCGSQGPERVRCRPSGSTRA